MNILISTDSQGNLSNMIFESEILFYFLPILLSPYAPPTLLFIGMP
jgi:hypothetical protein